jgi:hypothetical protein
MADIQGLVFGLFFLTVGVAMARWPYTISRWNEIIDAIGRKSAGRVEPADWQVTLTRLLGIALSIVGGFMLLLTLAR